MKTSVVFSMLGFQFLFLYSSSAQVNEWVWLHGDTTTNSPGNFGTQGIPSNTNEPPAVYEPCEWTDLNGNLWLFGGLSPTGEFGDLWKYDPAADEWTWMRGNGITNDPGNYGVSGVSSPSNLPPGRAWGATTWTDNGGDLWMFGGYQAGTFSDLWKYSISTNEWTWVKGPNTTNQPGVFGIQGVPDPANNPESRAECASGWTDNANNLWLFGGFPGYRNDMWRYNITTNEWTWMKGPQAGGQAGVYGTFGVEDPANIPGERESYSHWTDANGNLYLFARRGSFQSFNDFWKFNTLTNNWAWIGGPNTGNAQGHYGVKCLFDSVNIPGSRFENRSVCKDQFGNFWLYGGGSLNNIISNLNDVWMYCLATNQWVWVTGDSIVNPPTHYGIRGVSSPLNSPPGKAGAVMWCDQNGHLYVFGGNGSTDKHNDLWKFTIDYSCLQCSSMPVAVFSAPNHICPGTCTDFTNLSGNATTYQWIFSGANPSTSTDVNPSNICYNTPGSYGVTLIATNASGSDTLMLNNYITVYPYPAPQGIQQSGDTLFANAGAVSYQWYQNGTLIPGATDYFYVAMESGDYNVVATDANGCSVEAVINDVIAEIQPEASGNSKQFILFPNPVAEEFTIRNSGFVIRSAAEISIYNMLGEKVYSGALKLREGQPTIDCRLLPPGMFWLEINCNENIFRIKFIKK